MDARNNGLTQLRQGDFRLGREHNVGGNTGRLAPHRIGSPVFRKVELVRDGNAALAEF